MGVRMGVGVVASSSSDERQRVARDRRASGVVPTALRSTGGRDRIGSAAVERGTRASAPEALSRSVMIAAMMRGMSVVVDAVAVADASRPGLDHHVAKEPVLYDRTRETARPRARWRPRSVPYGRPCETTRSDGDGPRAGCSPDDRQREVATRVGLRRGRFQLRHASIRKAADRAVSIARRSHDDYLLCFPGVRRRTFAEVPGRPAALSYLMVFVKPESTGAGASVVATDAGSMAVAGTDIPRTHTRSGADVGRVWLSSDLQAGSQATIIVAGEPVDGVPARSDRASSGCVSWNLSPNDGEGLTGPKASPPSGGAVSNPLMGGETSSLELTSIEVAFKGSRARAGFITRRQLGAHPNPTSQGEGND